MTRRKDMRRIRVDGMCYSMMVGTGETYLALYALAVGMAEVTAGLIASVPMLAGALLQVLSPSMVRLMGSHKRWVILCVLMQALSFVPLIAGAAKGTLPGWMVFAAAGVYWGSGMAAGAAWSTWVGTIVPKGVRAKFFASRTLWMHATVLVGIVGAGEFLEATKAWKNAALPFVFTFGVACLCRCMSAYMLSKQSEPEPRREAHKHVHIGAWLTRLRHRPDGRLLGLMLAMQLAVWVSGPYFAPFMKEQLKLDYRAIEILLATAYTARVIALRWLGEIVKRVGERMVLRVAGLGVVPMATLWLVSDNFWWLMGIQVLSGSMWAAYELSTFLLQLETIAEEERTSVLTTYNIGSAMAMVSGAMIGGWMLRVLG
ncbi:MAG TPA: MFS transporter, partial [Phycisphaerales bacterium]|nr:MFS transporter [Phycisphaerales bacterium]